MQSGSSQGPADILIPVHNRYCGTRTLLEGIYRYSDYPFHIYILDNGSVDETCDLGRIYTRDITIVRMDRNRGWHAAVNHGIQVGANPYVVVLSNELQVARGWLGNMIAFLNTHPRIAAVGPLTSGWTERQCVDRVREELVPQIPRFFTEDIHERNRILQYHFRNAGVLVDGQLSFSCAALRRRAIDRVGLLASARSEENGAGYCRRLRKAGYVLGLVLDTYVTRQDDAPQAGAGA
jgi:GT2 family glycosyltransferase